MEINTQVQNQHTLHSIDELSKAYQRIVSCGDKAEEPSEEIEKIILEKMATLVNSLQPQ